MTDTNQDQDDKPERETKRFEFAGLDCKIIPMEWETTDRHYWCGYVRVPDDMEKVRWRSTLDEEGDLISPDVDVWGGITYGPDQNGWVGFDDAHLQKLVTQREAESDRAAVKNETQRLAEQIAGLREVDSDTERGEGNE